MVGRMSSRGHVGELSNDIQEIPFELNQRNEKWLFMCIYRSPMQNNQYFLENLSSIADHYSTT